MGASLGRGEEGRGGTACLSEDEVVAVLASGLDIVGFIGGYAAVYVAGAALYIFYVLRGPFRIAATPRD